MHVRILDHVLKIYFPEEGDSHAKSKWEEIHF